MIKFWIQDMKNKLTKGWLWYFVKECVSLKKLKLVLTVEYQIIHES